MISRWFVYKHSKPLPQDIVRFVPYADSDDHYRGTTVLPYLETFYQYGTDGGMERPPTVTGEYVDQIDLRIYSYNNRPTSTKKNTPVCFCRRYWYLHNSPEIIIHVG